MVARRLAEVSSLGRFKNINGVISKPCARQNGYVSVMVHNKKYYMHRLVAIAFKIPRDHSSQQTVDHINGNPSDNRLCNLRWASTSEQIQYSYVNNTERKSSAKKLSKPVLGRKIGEEEWTEYKSCHAAARQLVIGAGSISKICRGKGKSIHSYEFQYATPNEPEVLENEEWRNVLNTTAAVSSLGRFKNVLGVISDPSPKSSGYVRVKIHHKGYYIHRLIMDAFEIPRDNTSQQTVDHINGNPSDNRLCNLRWASTSEQIQYSYVNNTERKSNAKKLSKPVLGRKIGEETWIEYESINSAARQLKIPWGPIGKICSGKGKSIHSYEFKYATPNEPEVLEDEEWRMIDEAMLTEAKKEGS